ncbi:SidA/IucD/PvdA family monooxygenase [Micromonospora sp. ATCC 39149]|uniref:L-lysine N6-monooxygenase MbtG n=1 Tax=Micromonospora carbonacea TaxID=47853 RepID=A0A7D5YHJ6_9ACTN|nr:SidA/IucD/PvdA family monooxygenase [Micromonospora sp. ATCC 39149]QLK00496.1 SidA/IucD/PvdA family monooxygenase [Micromonospora carbonacea]
MLAAAMMPDGADIQNHPVSDLVTPRNPRSRYTFVNFLHEQGRLSKYLNLPVDRPLRKEYARYIQWVAETVPADVDYGRNVTAIRFAGSGAEVRTTDGGSYLGRPVVVAPGRSPYLPTVFDGVPFPRAVHTSRFLPGIADWTGTGPARWRPWAPARAPSR